MTFLDLVRARRSVRAYRSEPVADDLLAHVLEAGRLAPTAANRQPIRILVIHTAGREVELGLIYHREWFLQAPLIIGVCAVPAEAWSRSRFDDKSYADVDAAIVMDHMVLAAASLGLGTCWVAAFDPAVARAVLGLPDEVEPVAFTPLGFPAEQPPASSRRSLADLVRYERW